MSQLSVKDVSIRFGGVVALDGVSLELNRGEVLGLIGPNGAGKTTLFNIITGVLPPNGGEITFEGRSVLGMRPHERARLGIARTFQNLQLWSSMTVLENLKLPIDALGKRNIVSDALGLPFSVFAERAATERARGTLHALDLLEYENTLAGDLPVGLQRRVEVARALCLRPRLLLLDEPAAGLDAEETVHFGRLLTRIRERFKVSMLLVDHDMSLVMSACDYIYVLDFGKILSYGRPEEVRNDTRVIHAYLGESASDSELGATEEAEDTTIVTHETHPASEAPKSREPLLEVRGMAAGYGHLEVIRDVNLTVGRGEVVAVIGANGAGKTTTLRAISGVIKPNRGAVAFDGVDLSHARIGPISTGYWAAQQIVKLGLLHVPQGRGLFPKLTVEETLRLTGYSGAKGADFSPAYETFPVLKERRNQLVGTLSGGQQQMLAMARAILAKPKLLMVDEMSQGLAPSVVQRLFEWIRTLKNEGIAVLLVEQFVDSALGVADRAYIIEHGTVAQEADAKVLRRDKSLIARSYLGAAAEEQPAAAANGHAAAAHPEMLEEIMVKLPAALVRTIQEKAAREGRKPEDLVVELLGGN